MVGTKEKTTNRKLICLLSRSDPDKDTQGWGENDRGVSFTFGADVVAKFLNRHDMDLSVELIKYEQILKIQSNLPLFFCFVRLSKMVTNFLLNDN